LDTILGIILGILALGAQPHPLPQDFIDGALTRSEAYFDAERNEIGLRWSPFYEGTPEHALRPSELMAEPLGMQHDYSYAALDLDTMRLVTGP
jgi:hypothetical protein